MSDSGKAVFLSYASQDAEAAKRICEALRAAGVEVWFDQDELVGGDAWDAKIRGQISACGLFLPVISTNTQARKEGYFRIEWRLAAQRTHAMSDDAAFLLPLVIDDTRDADARVPVEFKAVQWTRLPGGETPPAFPARVKKLLGGEAMEAGRRRPADRDDGAPAPTNHQRLSRFWWVLPIFGVTMALVLVLKEKRSGAGPVSPAVPTATPAGVPGAESPSADALRRVGAILRKTDVARAELELASEVLAAAVQRDPANALIYAMRARVDFRYLDDNYDWSESRKDSARRQVAQAAALAPNLPEVRFVRALGLKLLGGPGAQREATTMFRELAVEQPSNPEVLLGLAGCLRSSGDIPGALAKAREAEALPGAAGRALFRRGIFTVLGGDFAGGLDLIRQATEREPAVEFLLWQSFIETIWLGDTARARQTLARVPAEFFLEDMPASAKYFVEVRAHDYEAALATIRAVPRDYVQSGAGAFSTGYLRGRALHFLGRTAAAESEWRAALALIEKRLTASGNDRELLMSKAVLLAALGEHEAAAKVWSTVTELFGPVRQHWLTLYYAAEQSSPDELVALLAEGQGLLFWLTAAELRIDPLFDKARGDPRFAALLRAAEADPKRAPALAAPEAKSVAVLAFANLSDDKANEYFSDGISEELLNVLAKVQGLKVTARTSAFFFKGKDVPIPEIAQKLGVAYVVEGSVRKSGDKVRITAQLIKAADGFHVWSDTFTRDLKDVFAVQDEIAGLIAQALSLQLGAVPDRGPGAVDPRAFEIYVRARQAWSLRTKESFARAENLLHEAIKLSPDFVRARAALVDVRQMRDFSRYAIGRFGQRQLPELERYLAETRAVLAVAPDLAEAYATMGLSLGAQWKQGEARAALRRALDLNPNYATAHQWYGMQLAEDGHMDEALAELKLASELDPLSFIILDNYGWLLTLAGRYTDALAILDRALALNPRVTQTGRSKALALAALGRQAEAQQLMRQVLGDYQELEPFYLAEVGLKAEAAARLASEDPQRKPERYRTLLSLGRVDEAFALLADPVGVHVNERMELIFWPTFDGIRNDPRFAKALEILHLTEGNARAQAWRAAHPAEKPEAKP